MKKAELMTKASSILPKQNNRVDVRKLGEYIGNNVVGINVFVKYPKGRIQLPASLRKMRENGILEHGDAFYNERVSKASVALIPSEFTRDLHCIETRVRRSKNTRCVAGDYMPAQMFSSFKEEFDAAQKEFYAIRDKIISSWDECMSQYENGIKELLENISMDQAKKDQIATGLLNEAPTKEEYEKGFEMTLTVYVFPSKPNRPALAPEIIEPVVELWDASVAATVILSVEQLIGQGWERLNAAMKQFRRNGAICAKTIGTIVNYGRIIPDKNLFKNDLLTYLQKALPNFLNMTGEQQVNEIERCIVKMYAYAKAHNIDLDMDGICAYSTDELDVMAKSKVAAPAPASDVVKVTIVRQKDSTVKPTPRSRYTRFVERRKALKKGRTAG